MVTYIDVPSAPGRLSYILSTPGKKVAATEIDPSFPTVLLCHQPWVNMYIYYPQFEDPSLNEHFNLLAIDLPGHGLNRLKEPLEGEITWPRMAGLFYEGLQALGLKKVHLVGSEVGTLAPMHMAIAHPEIVESLTLVNPPGRTDPESVLLGYAEWFAVQDEVRDTGNPDLIDILSAIMLGFSTGQTTNLILRGLSDELAVFAKAKMFHGEMSSSHQEPPSKSDRTCQFVPFHGVFMPLLKDRFSAPSPEELSRLDVPTLIIENVVIGDEEESEASEDVWVDIVDKVNALAASRGKPPLATRHTLVGEAISRFHATSRWTTLTHPELLTSLLKDFFVKTTSSSLFIHTESPLGRCQPRQNETAFDVGDIFNFLLDPSMASASQAEVKTWADMVSEMEQCGGVSIEETEVYVEVEE
ncbi:hypothetical protein L198_03602 [Cryptococcus wingfieldii CBS 7118]|uniref:AB hydrolase-1 domain-containing protein n=1 Tax=Cryptococcus wingfieldii CBS 7118 TaxID=1295528 RepID=A0A1E3JBU9_9TREE|nr:hypothetical protein L198_03602 [Cryptococcus wingfieldii CBS 7118]ODN98358.1 hypothetical protein L198_03602 [Cryptococcus wingfieldii CBS 7118]